MPLWKSIKSLQNRWMKLYERSSNISSLMLFGNERERLTRTSPTNSKLRLASTQPKMISAAVKKFKSKFDGQLGESTVHLFKQKYYQKVRKAKERTPYKEKQSIPSKRRGCPSDSGREWPAGASLDKGTHERWHPSEYPSCAGSCCGRDSQNSTSTITSWDQMGIQLVPTSNLTVEECGAKRVEIAAGHCHIGRHSLRGAFTTTGHFPREDWKGPPHIRFSQWLCVAHPKPLGKWRNDISLHWEHPHTLH